MCVDSTQSSQLQPEKGNLCENRSHAASLGRTARAEASERQKGVAVYSAERLSEKSDTWSIRRTRRRVMVEALRASTDL